MSQTIWFDTKTEAYDAVVANIYVLNGIDICMNQRKWWIYMISISVPFYTGLSAILLWRSLMFLCYRENLDEIPLNDPKRMKPALKPDGKDNHMYQSIIATTTAGKVLVVSILILNIASFIIYLIDISNHKWCTPFSENITQQIDLAFNMIFMLYFFFRFMVAPDKLWFMLDLFSLIDFSTIPPSILSVYLQQTWIGFRFMRLIYITTIPDLFENFKSSKKSKPMSPVLSYITTSGSIILITAGLIHVLENTVDPIQFEKSQELPYLTCIYIALLPPLGLEHCKTPWGIGFLVLYLPCYLWSSGALIFDIVYSIARKTGYQKRYFHFCGIYITFKRESEANSESVWISKDRNHPNSKPKLEISRTVNLIEV